MKTILLSGLLCSLLLPRVAAQSYSIDWHRVAAGGGASTGGSYAVNGTAGQAEAGGPVSGGSFSLTGGFWTLYAVQTAGLPRLSICYTAGSAVVSWPNTVPCTLQQTARVPGGSWVASPYPVTTLDGTNRVTISAPAGSLFFRLKQ